MATALDFGNGIIAPCVQRMATPEALEC